MTSIPELHLDALSLGWHLLVHMEVTESLLKGFPGSTKAQLYALQGKNTA